MSSTKRRKASHTKRRDPEDRKRREASQRTVIRKYPRKERFSAKLEARTKRGRWRVEIGNIKEDEIRFIDFSKRGAWETVYDGDALRLRRHKGTGVYVLIFRRTGDLYVLADEREAKRLRADLRKLYYRWHITPGAI